MPSERTWTDAEIQHLLATQSEQVEVMRERVRAAEARLAASDLVERAALALWSQRMAQLAGRYGHEREWTTEQCMTALADRCWELAILFAGRARSAAWQPGKEPQ